MSLSPGFTAFREAFEAGRPQVVVLTRTADLITPVAARLALGQDQDHVFLLESVERGAVRGRYSVIGLDPDLVWRCEGQEASLCTDPASGTFVADARPSLDSLKTLINHAHIDLPEGLPPMAAGLVGYMGYDMVRLVERLPDANPDTLGIPDGMLMRPRLMVVFDTITDTATLVTPVRPGEDGADEARAAYDRAVARLHQAWDVMRTPVTASALPPNLPATLGEPVSSTGRAGYHAMVAKAKEYILAGDIFQVVPSQRFSVPFPLSAMDLYRALRRTNPSPFLFSLRFPGFDLVGSSPEILVRLRDGQVTIRPIAGTRRRGADAAEDTALAKDLLADPKELAEHLMLLDLGRNDVGRVATTGSVTVTDQMVIEHYSHVMHIVSNVIGTMQPDKDAMDALMAGFPAGTVSGAPKVRAMEIIDELEPVRRSFYGGAVGYIAADGDMDTCIALRTALLKDGMLHIQAGGGVVADSDPEAEYQESCNKAMALRRAAQLALEDAYDTPWPKNQS